MLVNRLAKGTGRITQILDLVAQARPAPSSRQLFQQLEVPRSSGYELLSGLAQRQFLQSRAGGHWVLGEEIHVLAMSRYGLGQIAADIAPALGALQESTQEVVQFAVLEGSMTLITHTFGSLRAMRMVTDIGTREPVARSAAGRLLVSHLPDQALHQLFAAEGQPSPMRGRSMTAESFIGQVREARSRGYAVAADPVQEETCSIAAPLINKGGHCVATVNLVLPTARLTNSQDSLISLVCAAATKLARALADAVA